MIPALLTPCTLVAAAEGPVDVIDGLAGGLLGERLVAALSELACAQRPVRILSFEPGRVLRPVIGRRDVEVRITDGWGACWLLHTGDMVLSTFAPVLDLDLPPLCAVERSRAPEFFARLTDDFEDLWDRHDNVLGDPDQLVDWLEDEPDPEPHDSAGARPSAHTGQPVADSSDSSAVRSPAESTPSRRWPGHSD